LGPAFLQWELKISSQVLEYANHIAESVVEAHIHMYIHLKYNFILQLLQVLKTILQMYEGCIQSWPDGSSAVSQLPCLSVFYYYYFNGLS
jgi:hypothetical protein